MSEREFWLDDAIETSEKTVETLRRLQKEYSANPHAYCVAEIAIGWIEYIARSVRKGKEAEK